MNNLEIDPLQYGNDFDEDDVDEIAPTIVDHVLPEDFPMPCKCGKCARENICLCQINKLKCCQYCSCHQESCKNPTT